MKGKRAQLAERRFGKLIAIKDTGKRKESNVIWLCQCDCGHTTEVRAAHLKSGQVKSCGCSATTKEANMAWRIHGDAGGKNKKRHRLYQIWCSMRNRCKILDLYKKLGVCEEWDKSYVTFKDWAMKHGYRDNLTLDRKDNIRGYSPGNCQWITRPENSIKRKADRQIELMRVFVLGIKLGRVLGKKCGQ